MAWKSADGKEKASNLVSRLETLINGMLNKETLLDLIRHFVVFEKSKKENAKTGIVSISTVKKLAAYHQYYAVNRAVESALRATGYSLEKETPVSMAMESPESYGVARVKSQSKGDRKGGVVWHTQGSGKSLSMVFFTGKIVLALDNPTVLVITDRNDLDDQLFDIFTASTQLLRQEPKQVENKEDLTETQKAKAKWTQPEALIGSENRIKNIAKDIVSHFEARQEVFDGKGMIVSMSRRIVADLYEEIIK